MFAPIDSDVTVEYKRTSATIEVALEYRDTLEDLALIEQQASEMLAELITASMKASDINLGGLARSISYAGAEIEYPQTGSLTVGVTAIIAIRYSFKSDDPYTQ
ncbi:MAG: hypothetical protein KJN72_12140 [Woeseia sp.]|nr:hypothetical protein [Woeseia sp.]